MIKNLSDYQSLATRTLKNLDNYKLNIFHMRIGLITELGELLDCYKNNIIYGKELDVVNVGEELADMWWYMANWFEFTKRTLNLSNLLDCSDLLLEFAANSITRQTEIKPHDIEGYTMSLLRELSSDDSGEEHQIAVRLLELTVLICQFYKLDFHTLLENNIKKLQVRYPEKFSEEKALNRDLETERIALEKFAGQ